MDTLKRIYSDETIINRGFLAALRECLDLVPIGGEHEPRPDTERFHQMPASLPHAVAKRCPVSV